MIRIDIYKCFILFRIARFLRQSFRQSIRRFRGESVDAGSGGSTTGSSQADANLRGRQPRGKLSSELNFSAPPDYATVIIETQRHSALQLNMVGNSDSGSLGNASQDLATTSSLVSSELPLVESLQRNSTTGEHGNQSSLSTPSIQSASPPVVRDQSSVKRDSVHSQSFRFVTALFLNTIHKLFFQKLNRNSHCYLL